MLKKFFISIVFVLLIMFVLLNCFDSKAMTYYEYAPFETGIVTASALNVRCGPGTNYKSVGLVYRNEYVRIFAKVGNFYIIQTNSDLIGAVSTKYIRNASISSGSGNPNNSSDSLSGYSAREKELLELINEQRVAYGLSKLSFDPELQRVAKAKALDLVQNNYFDHNSPTYGSPFDMMKSFGISYKAAGENLAGNSTLKGAVTAWMNSEGHRKNILTSAFNYTGIGVVDSPVYGMIMVQMFVGK